MMMLRLVLILCTVGIASSAGAQHDARPGVERLTLEEALARGLATSQRLAELQAREEGAGAAVAGRRAAARPLVTLMGGYTRTNHVEEFGIAIPGLPPRVIYPDIPDNFRSRLDLQWPVYTGGRLGALEHAARAERAAAGEELVAARADLRLEITRAFWALVTARETETVVARSLDGMEAHVGELRSRLEQGLIPPSDVLSAEAQHSRARLLAIEARNTRATADADLHRLIGIEGDGAIEPLAILESEPVASGAPTVLVENARNGRPERRALEQRADASSARATAIAASARPQVAAVGGYDYGRPNLRLFPRTARWRESWDVSLNFTWLVWDGGRRRAELSEALAGARGAQARIAEFDRQAAFEVRQRWLELDSSRAAIEASDHGLRSATEARRVILERFNAGVAMSTDVVDAEIAVLQAALDRTRALATARVSDARLQRALGR